VDPQVVRLERLRQEAAAARWMAGLLVDYLDHGSPNDQQAREATAEIEAYERQSADAQRRLGELLTDLRATHSHAIEEWVGWHVSICKRILAEGRRGPPGANEVSDQDVRLYMAEETLREWEQVRVGQQDFVSINAGFLGDYDSAVTAAVEGADVD
jgi:hypothetical protein